MLAKAPYTFVFVILYLLASAQFAGTAGAIALPVPAENTLLFHGFNSDAGNRDAFRGVMTQLELGDLKGAKRSLAGILGKAPKHPRALELAGTILLQEKKLAAAAAAFERSLAVDSKNARVVAKLGVVELLQGRSAAGEKTLHAALRLTPDEPLALRYLGWLETSRGNNVPAIDYYLRIILSGAVPKDKLSGVHLNLANLYNLTRQYQASTALIEPLLAKVDPRLKSDALSLLFTAYTNTSRWADAKRTLSQMKNDTNVQRLRLAEATILRLEGKMADAKEMLGGLLVDAAPDIAVGAHYELAHIHRQANDWESAASALEAAIAIAEPTNLPSLLRDLTALLLSQDGNAKAMEILRKTAADQPGLPVIPYILAEVHIKAGRNREGLSVLGKLIDRHPDFAPAYYLSGVVLWHGGQKADARDMMTKATEHNPRYVDAWLTLAGMVHETNQPPDMATVLRRGLKANPGNSNLLFELASLVQSRNEIALANTSYRKILKKDPNHVPSLNNLALNLSNNERSLVEAMRIISRAYELAPKASVVGDTYGWILYLSGKAEAALPILEQAAAAPQPDGITYAHLAMVNYALGRIAKAREVAMKALEIGVKGADLERVKGVLNKIDK